ncbi:MAG: hypothetical protein CVU64_12620 [Deltaproteobacteria bacterium HGW-Deltaproteobacteria-21]|nr:MAG: hypothetical protein CVU64_12620 [Deltaproteobacteria bacterium HGW-Deltaproteobacteria-21]
MKRIILPVLFSISFLLVHTPQSYGGEPAPAKMIETYSNSLERLLSRYNAKADLRNSNLDNLKQAGALYWLKARFVENLKEELAREMLAQNIGEKEYQIVHYVNHRFFGMLRTATAKGPGIPNHANIP